jgi:hypothetical protein
VNTQVIERVISLANEVVDRAHEALYSDPEGDFIVGTKATGALRGTSMELTRALADLRRPG